LVDVVVYAVHNPRDVNLDLQLTVQLFVFRLKTVPPTRQPQ